MGNNESQPVNPNAESPVDASFYENFENMEIPASFENTLKNGNDKISQEITNAPSYYDQKSTTKFQNEIPISQIKNLIYNDKFPSFNHITQHGQQGGQRNMTGGNVTFLDNQTKQYLRNEISHIEIAEKNSLKQNGGASKQKMHSELSSESDHFLSLSDETYRELMRGGAYKKDITSSSNSASTTSDVSVSLGGRLSSTSVSSVSLDRSIDLPNQLSTLTASESRPQRISYDSDSDDSTIFISNTSSAIETTQSGGFSTNMESDINAARERMNISKHNYDFDTETSEVEAISRLQSSDSIRSSALDLISTSDM